MSAPSPYDYLDYRAFLGAWFEHKKQANPRFSHRMFARMAGQKSPSLLHHVLLVLFTKNHESMLFCKIIFF